MSTPTPADVVATRANWCRCSGCLSASACVAEAWPSYCVCHADRVERCACPVPPPEPRGLYAYRLTDSDEAAVRARITEVFEGWRRDHRLTIMSPPGRTVAKPPPAKTADNIETLVRLGAHAIGCSLHDLRDGEIAWLRREVDDLWSPW